jgi:HEAT repeat protein
VARELGWTKDRAAVEPLRAVAGDRDPEVRAACLWALGEIGDPSAAPAVRFYVCDPQPSVRLAAVEALSKLNCPAAAEGLREAMRNADPEVRRLALAALATRGRGDAIREVVRALADDDPLVRHAAMEHVARLGDRAVPYLKELARRAEPPTAVLIVEALTKTDAQRGADALISVLREADPAIARRRETDRPSAVRRAAIDALARIGEPAVEPMLRMIVQVPDEVPLKRVAGEVFVRTGSGAAAAGIAARILKWAFVPDERELELWRHVLRRMGTPEAKEALAEADAHVAALREKEARAAIEPAAGRHPTAEGLEALRGDRDVTLRLKGAVRGRDLLITFECRRGRWPEVAWGYAPNLNKGDHEVHVAQVAKTEAGAKLDLEVAVASDHWIRGGPARYVVELKTTGPSRLGDYRGTFRGRKVQGHVTVAVADPWPIVLLHQHLARGEHPRLRERHRNWQPPQEPRVTEQGNAAMRKAMHPRGPPLAVEAARPMIESAYLYDEYYYQADPELRKRAADFLLRKARGLLFGHGGMSTPWHNWQGRWRAGAGIALLAMVGDPTSHPPRPPDVQVIRIEAPGGYRAGEGVPVSELNGDPNVGHNAVATTWLAAGPFPLAAREQCLANLGGPEQAGPRPGSKLTCKGLTREFRLFEAQTLADGIQHVDLKTILDKRQHQVLYFFAVVENPFAHTVRVALDARTRLWLAGREVRSGQVLYVPVGALPALAEVQVGALPPFARARWALPQLEEIEDPREALRKWQAGRRAWRDSGGASPEAWRMLKLVEINLKRYLRWAVGDGGFNTEKEGYTSATLGEMAPFLHGYYYCFGKNLIRRSHAAWIPLRHKAGSFTGRGGGARFYSGRHIADLLPPEFRKALTARTPAEFPGYCIRDRQKAGYVFRNGWHGDDRDILMTVEGKGQHLRSAHTSWDTGTFRIFGLGSAWAVYSDYGRDAPRLHHNVVLMPEDDINGLLPAREIYFHVEKDGSGIVSLDMNDVYLGRKGGGNMVDFEGRVNRKAVRDLGIRGVRSFAADFSGACGAPGLFVVVDRISGGGRKEWIMHLPSARGARVTADVRDRTFTLHSEGVKATLRGTFVVPESVRLEASPGLLKATGPGDFFVVMTLQEGAPPRVGVEGEGLRCKVMLAADSQGGGRSISFDGEKVVLSRRTR